MRDRSKESLRRLRSPLLGDLTWLLTATGISCTLTLALAAEVSAQVKEELKPWSLRFGLEGAFEDNVLYTSDGSSDFSSRLGVAFGRDITLRRGRIGLNAEANRTFYRRDTNVSPLTFAVAAAGSYLITRRLKWDVNGGVTTSYAQETSVPTDVGLRFPKTLTRINSGFTQFTYDLTAKTQVRGWLSAQTASFDVSPLYDSSNVSAHAIVNHQFTRSHSFGATWNRTFSSLVTGNLQALLGTWQAQIGNAVTLDTAGGVLPYRVEGRSGYQYAPGGSVGIAAQLGLKGTVAAHYDRTVEQAYGFSATHRVHRLTGAITVPVSARMTLEGSASYSINANPVLPDFRLIGEKGAMSVRYQIASDLNISGLYSAWVSRLVSEPSIVAHRVGVSLVYGFSWR